ncbi:LptE family protein [Dokdonia sp. Hel_I_53]|uniref:LptE family protein n=1 Tax=Dokdonia sp. Hel_I_53 TaxID=1566287 RepID=UPI00119C25B6|nr:LptE family protein [Dokdonia sp. Hel_I_53]TVZ52153.1 lipopolysaccharide assembly protein [Dokdonia sp. Hel_I_53]
MKTIRNIALLVCFVLSLQSCGVYSLSGVSITTEETFEVRFFQNEAAIVEPGIDLRLTNELRDLIANQSPLSITNTNADVIYEGEIVEYYIAPQASTSENTAAQNRLTVTVNCRFYNNTRKDGTYDFERRFSFFSDVPGSNLLTGSQLDTALDEIFERITQDIFNASLARW